MEEKLSPTEFLVKIALTNSYLSKSDEERIMRNIPIYAFLATAELRDKVSNKLAQKIKEGGINQEEVKGILSTFITLAIAYDRAINHCKNFSDDDLKFFNEKDIETIKEKVESELAELSVKAQEDFEKGDITIEYLISSMKEFIRTVDNEIGHDINLITKIAYNYCKLLSKDIID